MHKHLNLQRLQSYTKQLQTAASKDEALAFALNAAENLMKALKLSSRADEKKQLKARCGALMDAADRIKNSEEWTPSVDPNTKEARILRWAANIDPRHSPGPAYQEVGRACPVEHTPRSRPPGDLLSASGNSPISSISFPSQTQQLYAGSTLCRDDSRHASIPLIDLSDDQSQTLYERSWNTPADAPRKDSREAHKNDLLDTGIAPEATQRAPPPLLQPGIQQSITAATDSAELVLERAKVARLASSSHIHRLTEPASTRKRSRKEDIILLKASIVNGFKCPPWDKSPATTEFLPENGQSLFQYVCSHHC
jgi:calpain-7